MNDSKDKPSTQPRGRRALGRGLDALLPAPAPTGLRTVDVLKIEPNPNQPRQHFEPDALSALAVSLKAHGVLQPLVVSEVSTDRYRLIVGERRWQASKLAGLRDVPVIVREASDRESLELALVENLQRRDLNALEEAAAYQRLIQEFELTQQEVANQVGRSRAAVANTLRLLALPDVLKRAVIDERITEGHARALLGLSTVQDQITALELVETKELNVRQTEDLVRRAVAESPVVSTRPARDPDIEAAECDLRRSLGTKVTLRPGRRGGRIVIEYFSADEFETLYRRLLGED